MSKLDDILDNEPIKAAAGFTTRRKEEVKDLMLELTEWVPGMTSPEATIAIIQKRIEDL